MAVNITIAKQHLNTLGNKLKGKLAADFSLLSALQLGLKKCS